MIAHALTDPFGKPGLGWEFVPGGMPFVQRRRAVGLGQSVEMGELEACLVHLGQHGGGWRGGCMVEGHAMIETTLLIGTRIEQG